MAITERVGEAAGAWRQDLRETLENLKDEVAELKSLLRQWNPLGRSDSLPVRRG